MTLDQLKQLNPVDFAVLNLQSFAINILGVGKMEVGGKRKDVVEKVAIGRVLRRILLAFLPHHLHLQVQRLPQLQER